MGLFADEINERDVEDLRMSAHKKPYKELQSEWLNKAIAGKVRGKEGLVRLKPGVNPNDLIGKRWCKINGDLEDHLEYVG